MISIIVCTQDRPQLLDHLLGTLAEQTLAPSCYEILVVDNGCETETRSIVVNASRGQMNLRYYREPRIGLSYARNRGWREAKGTYVGFTDDDCRIPPQWLTVAHKIITERQPAIFGGPYYPFYIQAKPRWFRDHYGSRAPELTAEGAPDFSGGNIFFQKKLLEQFGGFRSYLGMSGRKIAWGEETEIQKRIWERMPKALYYYEPQLYVYHLVRPEKMKLRWLIPAWLAKGRDRWLMSPESRTAFSAPMLRCAGLVAKILWDSTVGTLLRDRSQYSYSHNYWYEHTSKYIKLLGFAWSQMKLRDTQNS